MFLLAELHGFLCGPRDQHVQRNAWSSIPARNNIQSIQSLFENDGTKKTSRCIIIFSIIFDDYLGVLLRHLQWHTHWTVQYMIFLMLWSTFCHGVLDRSPLCCLCRDCVRSAVCASALLGGSWLKMVDGVWILFETQGQNAFHNHPEHVSVRKRL